MTADPVFRPCDIPRQLFLPPRQIPQNQILRFRYINPLQTSVLQLARQLTAVDTVVFVIPLLLCKIQGTEPQISRFFCFFTFPKLIFAFRRQKSVLCNFLQSFLCKTVSALLFDQKIGHCYWRRTDLHKKPDENGSPTRRSRASLYMTSLFPHFAVPFENSTRKLSNAYFSRQGADRRHAIKTNLSVQSAKQIKDQ